jgi:hypothetical protein
MQTGARKAKRQQLKPAKTKQKKLNFRPFCLEFLLKLR